MLRLVLRGRPFLAPVGGARLRHDVHKAGRVGTSTQEIVDSQQWADMQKMDFDELVRLEKSHVCSTFLDEHESTHKKSRQPTLPRARKAFRDKIRVHLQAGNGGSGAVSFYRGPRQRTGPPDGGDGGRGGSIIIRAKEMELSLNRIRHYHRAGNGQSGMKANRNGKAGATLFLDVPVGTVITEYFPPKTSEYDDPEDEKYAKIKEMIESADYINEEEYEEPIVEDDEEDEEEKLERWKEHEERKNTMKVRGKRRLAKMKVEKVEEETQESDEGSSLETGDEYSEDAESDESGEGIQLPKSKSARTRASLVNSDDSVFMRAVRQYDQKYTPTPKAEDARSEVQEELEVQMQPNGEKGRSVDLDVAGNFVVACKGGNGGYGNRRWASGTNRSPKQHTTGQPGEDRWFIVELKMLAQAGLVGFPNAGKSSLLHCVSNARPKVAHYPFTTLTPSIGTVQFEDTYSYTIADLPGIIEGASQNRGLGIEFLRHIERTKVICFVLDMSGQEKRHPWDDFLTLREEMHQYKPELLLRAALIIANKMDLVQSEVNLVEFTEKLRSAKDKALASTPIFEVSAKNNTGIEDVTKYLRGVIEEVENATQTTKEVDFDIETHDLSAKYQKFFEDDE